MVDLQHQDKKKGSTSSRNAGKGLTILIVDDSSDMRAYVRHCLGYLENQIAQINEAANGREALEFAQRVPTDLVISDIVMPEFDGYELCKALKNLPNVPPIRVLLISGEVEVHRLHHAGADAFLGKPFNADRMRTSLDTFMGTS